VSKKLRNTDLWFDRPNDLDEKEETLGEPVDVAGVASPPNPGLAIPPPDILSSLERARAERCAILWT